MKKQKLRKERLLPNFEGARLASTLDVAAMKINAVIGRGTQKDFYDIYELLKHFTLSEIFDAYQNKYRVDNTAMARDRCCTLRMPRK